MRPNLLHVVRFMMRHATIVALLAAAMSAQADNTVESCYIEVPREKATGWVQGKSVVFVGSVCYNHGIYSVHESHIRERCNKAYKACAEHPGGCISYSYIGAGKSDWHCEGHDGQPWPIPTTYREQ